MKSKVLAILVAAFIALAALTGCGGTKEATDSPSAITAAALDALKQGDLETVQQYYAGEISESMLQSAGGFDVKLDDMDLTPDQRAVVDKLIAKIWDFDYKIMGEKVEGNKAQVQVRVTTYNFGGLLKQVAGEYMQQAWTSAMSGSGVSEEAMKNLFFDTLDTNLDMLSKKDKSTTITVSLTKDQDGEWKIQELDKQAIDGFLGGILSMLGSLVETLSSLLH